MSPSKTDLWAQLAGFQSADVHSKTIVFVPSNSFLDFLINPESLAQYLARICQKIWIVSILLLFQIIPVSVTELNPLPIHDTNQPLLSNPLYWG